MFNNIFIRGAADSTFQIMVFSIFPSESTSKRLNMSSTGTKSGVFLFLAEHLMLLKSGGSRSMLPCRSLHKDKLPSSVAHFFFSSCPSFSSLPLPSHNKLQTKARVRQTKHKAQHFSLDITWTDANMESLRCLDVVQNVLYILLSVL